MTSLTDGSTFNFEIPLYENDAWLGKIPQQLHLLIEERNRIVSASVITVLHDSFIKVTDDYVALTMKLLNEHNDYRNSFIVANVIYSSLIHESPRNDSMVILFIDVGYAVSFKYYLNIFK